MKNLYLADLAGFSEEEVKQHIAKQYSGEQDSKYLPTMEEIKELKTLLGSYSVVVAYEEVDYSGCDSISWFLLQEKSTGEYFEFCGSHCSEFGFEGQFDLEETSLEYLSSQKSHIKSSLAGDIYLQTILKFLNDLQKEIIHETL